MMRKSTVTGDDVLNNMFIEAFLVHYRNVRDFIFPDEWITKADNPRTLPDLTLTPISQADHLSVDAQWSPTGKNIVYADYTQGGVSLVAADLRTGKITRLTNPQGHGMDRWLAWH